MKAQFFNKSQQTPLGLEQTILNLGIYFSSSFDVTFNILKPKAVSSVWRISKWSEIIRTEHLLLVHSKRSSNINERWGKVGGWKMRWVLRSNRAIQFLAVWMIAEDDFSNILEL